MAKEQVKGMTIGRVAGVVGVAATTLRFYEREGILAPSGRTAKGYRLYDDGAVRRLEFIRAAQAVGFTLDDIRSLLQVDGESSCQDVQRLIEHRLADVDRKLADLTTVRETLAGALDRCRESNQGCPVLADLNTHETTRRSN